MGALQTTFVLANQLRFGWDTQQNGLALALAGLGSAVVQGLLVRAHHSAFGRTAGCADRQFDYRLSPIC